MRVPVSAAVLAGLLTALPLGVLAQGPTTYEVERWPQSRPKSFGRAEASGVATDADGRVYVFQRAKNPLLVFEPNGRFVRTWGRGTFSTPHGCRIDRDGNLWLTDLDRHQVFKYTRKGNLLATWGVKGRKGNDSRHFNMPADVAFGPNGDFYVADGYGNARVVQFSHEGEFIRAWGAKGSGPGQFKPAVHSITCDAQGRVYVADRGNRRIQIFEADGTFVDKWEGMGYVNGITVTPDQRLLVVEGYSNTSSLYELNGRLISRWGGRGRGAGQMYGPHMVCTGPDGCVYVAEISNKRVQRFDPR